MTETASKTGLTLAHKAYEQLLAIKPSFPTIPTEEQEQREHDRVHFERVNVIYDIYHAAYSKGAEDAKR